MDKHDLYQVWSPEASPWSPWVKPCLFAFHPHPSPIAPSPLRQGLAFSWLPSAESGCALVVDLPGPESPLYGMELAARGFRPIPVFASCPPDGPDGRRAKVDAEGVLAGLVAGADALPGLSLPAQAPPAFLLDASRQASAGKVPSEVFDNRSAVFASDFPSAAKLREHGIRRCVIIRDGTIPAEPDLGYALLPWKRDGVEIAVAELDGAPLDFPWPPEGFWRVLWHRVKLSFSLTPNPRGGYGRFIGDSSGG